MYMRYGNIQQFSDDWITSSTRRSTFCLVFPRNCAILIPANGVGYDHIGSPVPEFAWDCQGRLFFINRHWGGSDWRVVKLYCKAFAPENGQSFVALFILTGGKPDCWRLRWREEWAVMFGRRHRTETTKLEEFRHVVQRAKRKIVIEGTTTELAIRLIPINTNEHPGMPLRMELCKWLLVN